MPGPLKPVIRGVEMAAKSPWAKARPAGDIVKGIRTAPAKPGANVVGRPRSVGMTSNTAPAVSAMQSQAPAQAQVQVQAQGAPVDEIAGNIQQMDPANKAQLVEMMKRWKDQPGRVTNALKNFGVYKAGSAHLFIPDVFFAAA